LTSLLRRHQRADLPDLLEGLDEALTAMEGRADPEITARGRALVARAGERLRLSGEHTVVALAGATGSGKSSLFNALAREALSPTGVRRPTTSRPHARVWGEEGAAPLLQWLGVPLNQASYSAEVDVRSASSPNVEDLSGLILLDLPDHDSTAVEHRLEVDRLVELVDLLVWVVDPQKYADALLHERYLRRLAGHDAVTVIVLNQIDTLTAEAAAACVSDLRRLIEQDGLRRSQILACSARSGSGLEDLRRLLADAVQRRQARNDRLVADVEAVIGELSSGIGPDARAEVGKRERTQLVDALSAAAGVPAVGSAVQKSWERRGAGSVGWPLTRWLRRLRPDPLRRLHLQPAERDDVRSMVRSSVPEPTALQRAQVDTALRRVYEAAADGLPRHWQAAVRRATSEGAVDVRDQLDAAVVATDLGLGRTPVWWRLASALQWLLLAAAVVGLGWLALLAFGSYLRLPEPPTPEVEGFPLPTLLLLGGLLAGFLLAFLARFVVRAGGRTRRRRAETRLRAAISAVAERLVVAPVEAELARHAAARDALERARAR
jgi:GTP-binding protein EngB required for normal cell division